MNKREFLDYFIINQPDGSQIKLTEQKKDEWVKNWEALESFKYIVRTRRRQLGDNVMAKAYGQYYEATFGKDKLKIIK